MNDPGRVNARPPRKGRSAHGARETGARRDGRETEAGQWIYGVHAVEGRLRVRPGSVRAVYVGRRESSRRREIAELAARHGIAVQETDDEQLRRHAGSDAHQGVVARVTPFEYSRLEVASATGRPVLVVDQMYDPHNLGALMRTAVAAGFAGVVIPERGAAAVTAAVEKAAAGAANHLAVCRVVNLVRTLGELAAAGYWRLALTPREAPSLFEIEIPTPVALVLGGETGLRRLALESCDLTAAIPQAGPVESLNASVAGAIAMYEILRRGAAPTGNVDTLPPRC